MTTTTRRTGAMLLLAIGLTCQWPTSSSGDGHTPPWFTSAPTRFFAYSQPISIATNVAMGDLTNFPVLIVLTNAGNPVFSHTQSTGNDIAFYSADGQMQLAHELETYTNSGSPQMVAWVKVPRLYKGQETTLQMCYGNAELSSRQSATSVWANGFGAVWHLNDTPAAGGLNRDSSPAQIHATRTGAGTTAVAGQIAGANAYNGTDDYATTAAGVPTTSNGFTISAWAYLADKTALRVLETGADPWYLAYRNDWDQFLLTAIDTNGVQRGVRSVVGSVGTGQWCHVAFVASPAGAHVYVNGVENTTSADIGPTGIRPDVRAKYIGVYTSGAYPWRGRIDELRVCNTPRSADWIRACYVNQSDSTRCVAFGPEQSLGHWEHRQMITISSNMSPATLTNFPVLVLITNQQNALFGHAQSGGNDVLFTTSDGVTRLPHEIELYTASGTTSLAAWVKAPSLAPTSDTVLYMYYGNASAPRQGWDAWTVWDTNFLAVWHLNEAVTAGGTNRDATANAVNAIRAGSGAGGATGKIGGANAYNGTDDGSVTPSGVTIGTNGFTISAWVYRGYIARGCIFESGTDGSDYSYIYDPSGTDQPLFTLRDAVGTQRSLLADAHSMTMSNWQYVAWVATPTQVHMYVDGVDRCAGGNPVAGLSARIRAKYIGVYSSPGASWLGRLDEFRVCNTPRSADWVKTCYNNQSSPATYLSFGRDEDRQMGTQFMFR